MQLEPVDDMSQPEWSEAVAPFDTAMFFHDAAWLTFLEDTGRGDVVRFRITENGAPVGYLAALLLRKGPFRILGSPISGSMSEYMGPAADEDLDVDGFLRALDDYCRAERIHHVEIGSPILQPETMTAYGYETSKWKTYRVPLSTDPDEMWANLTSKCRNRIRKGWKNDLVAEDSDDPAFVDRHYSQVEEVFALDGRAPPFAIDDLRALVEALKPHDLAFTLQVRREGTDDVVATGIFPHDAGRVYSLSTASRVDARPLCPNELLHWEVMRRAGLEGLRDYSMGDDYRTTGPGGRFKAKFNGDYVPVFRHERYYSPFARYARRLYTRLHRLARKVGVRLGR